MEDEERQFPGGEDADEATVEQDRNTDDGESDSEGLVPGVDVVVDNDVNPVRLVLEPLSEGLVLRLRDLVEREGGTRRIPSADPVAGTRVVGRHTEKRDESDETAPFESLSRRFLVLSIVHVVAQHCTSQIHRSVLVRRVQPTTMEFYSVPKAFWGRRVNVSHPWHQHVHRL